MQGFRALFVVMLAASWAAAQPAGTASAGAGGGTCVSCHSSMGGDFAAPVTAEQNSVHRQHSLWCTDCHGGDSTQTDPSKAMNPAIGFIGTPTHQQIPQFCGRCHSDPAFMKQFDPSLRVDQEAEYHTSVHGQLLRKGDDKVATCISCHGHHGILAVSEPTAPVYPTHVAETCGKCHANAEYMKPYSIPTDQVEKWSHSVHADELLNKNDLSAPTCNDCHGNHGAVPPGVDSVANVCGTCHVRQSDLFDSSPHAAAFSAMDLAGCVTCHSNHQIEPTSDSMLGVSDEAVCTQCHSSGDAGYQAAEKMRASIDDLSGQINQAEQLLQKAEGDGMEVSDPLFNLKDAHSKLIEARVAVHAFSPPAVEAAVDPGLKVAATAHQAGEAALHELDVRRLGLGVSLIVILLAVVALYFLIRRMEARA